MEHIAFEKVEELISHIYKADDVYEIDSYIQALQHELKRNELFVSKIFNSLDEKSIEFYREILNYLDGALYTINAYKTTEGTNPNGFVDLIKRGWTNIDYDDFIPFRSSEYRDPVICETTDLYTELSNEATDAGYNDLSKYINDAIAGFEDFCVNTLQAYYCDNIESNIRALRDPSWRIVQ